jgi:cell division protein FtsQ
MAVSAPADKRFRRAHVKPSRRRGKLDVPWKRVVWLGGLGAVMLYAGYRATSLVLSADALTVTRITVSGNVRMARGEVLSLLDGLTGRNMVLVNLEAWRQKLRTSPWVADAAIRRVLPGTVDVLISERQPLGIARLDDILYLVDREGAIIDEYGPQHAGFDLPIIDGLVAASADGAPRVDDPRAALVTRLLMALQDRPDLARRVSQIDVADARDAVLILKGDTTLVRVGDEQFAERLQSYLDLAPALRERVPEMDYVDLRFGERVYVRPQAPGPGAQKAQGLRRPRGQRPGP